MAWTALPVASGDRITAEMANELMDAYDERNYATTSSTTWSTYVSAGDRISADSISTLQAGIKNLVGTAQKWGLLSSYTDEDTYTFVTYTTGATSGTIHNIFADAGGGTDWATAAAAGTRWSASDANEFRSVLNLMLVANPGETATSITYPGRLKNGDYQATCAGAVSNAEGKSWVNSSLSGQANNNCLLTHSTGYGYRGAVTNISMSYNWSLKPTVTGHDLSDCDIEHLYFLLSMPTCGIYEYVYWPTISDDSPLARDINFKVRLAGSAPADHAGIRSDGTLLTTYTVAAGSFKTYSDPAEGRLMQGDYSLSPGDDCYVNTYVEETTLSGAGLCGYIDDDHSVHESCNLVWSKAYAQYAFVHQG